jgi:hypothetical protein
MQINHAGWNNSGMAADGLSRLVEKMLAAPLRYVSRLAFLSPLVKAGAGVLFLVTWFMPRRLPDLARFTASPSSAPVTLRPSNGPTGSSASSRLARRG